MDDLQTPVPGWMDIDPTAPAPNGRIDVKFSDGTSAFNVEADLVGWTDAIAYRTAIVADETDVPPVTLNEARKAMLHVENVCESQDAIFVNQIKESLETVKSFLNEAVSREVLNFEKSQVELNTLRSYLEVTARAAKLNAEQMTGISAVIANIYIAIARGKLSPSFMEDLARWAA